MNYARLAIYFSVCWLTAACAAPANGASDRTISLAGQWRFSRGGPQTQDQPKDLPTLSFSDTINLPGTTDTNQKGPAGTDRSNYSLTQPYGFSGTCWYERDITIPDRWRGNRVTLFLERTKYTQVWLDGTPIGDCPICCTPQEYVVSNDVSPGKHKLTIAVNNQRLPPSGADSHQFSGNTQGNWNGIIGKIELRMTDAAWIDDVQVYPDAAKHQVTVKVRLNSSGKGKGEGLLTVSASGSGISRSATKTTKVKWSDGDTTTQVELSLGSDAALWDEFHPVLHQLTVNLKADGVEDQRQITFGLRTFAAAGQQFTINGHSVFLRGKHDACVFPLTGYPPMEVDGWLQYLRVCQSYGLNHIRFHTWVPPEAAFEAADQLGFYLQPELPFWGAFKQDVKDKLEPEARLVLTRLGNHPSFVMFSMGNEHWDGRDVLASLVEELKASDPRHLYVRGTSAFFYEGHPGKGDDYLISGGIKNDPNGPLHKIRGSNGGKPDEQGHVQTGPVNTMTDYAHGIAGTTWPTVTHEMGQYSMFPDFRQIAKYTGVSKPYNLEHFQQNLKDAGMADQADDFAKASGALAELCYREDIESCLRTPNYGGFELLDLQDYPGQGTALVGMLDAFMDSKGIITPERWREFCAPVVLLASFPKYTWTQDETFTAVVDLAQYGEKDLHGLTLNWVLKAAETHVLATGTLPAVDAQSGNVRSIGKLSIPLMKVNAPARLQLELSLAGTSIKTSYPLWVYPSKIVTTPAAGVTITRSFDLTTQRALKAGAKVLLVCDENQTLARTVGGGFASDFWDFLFFHNKPGTMGILCDSASPALAGFPTESHADWQWFNIALHAQPLILDALFPNGVHPLVQVIDNYERCNKLGLIFETKVGPGRLLVCASDLVNLSSKHTEASQLLASLLTYVHSDRFNPQNSVSPETMQDLLRTIVPMTGCKATTSSYDHGWPNYSPEQLIDGNISKGWRADASAIGDAWCQVEFPKPIDLSGGEILWTDVRPGYKYLVQTSTDGSVWQTACDERNNQFHGSRHQFSMQASGVKFVKLLISGTPDNKPSAIDEMMFYPASVEPLPQSRTTRAANPVLPDFAADPSARVFNGKLYIYSSHDIAGSKGWDMLDWHAFSTDDMVNFTDCGVIFSLKDITWADKHAWAPDCINRNGKYYFYFPADNQIGVAVSDSPTGPFKDALGKPLIARNGGGGVTCIDPCVFIDDGGQAYLYFGNKNDHVAVVKLKDDMVTVDSAVTVLELPRYHEGIWVHKRNRIYYFSHPSYRGDKIANLMEYSIAKSPLGPFDYKGVILDNPSRNVHGSITEFKGEWYLFYHVAGPNPYERRVCVELLSYNPDGTIKPMQMTR